MNPKLRPVHVPFSLRNGWSGMRIAIPVFALTAASCGSPPAENEQAAPVANVAAPVNVAEAAPLPPVEPAAPGTPAGLPDDRTPVSEAPFTETSAQGAANVVQTYFALIEEKKYGQARALWGPNAPDAAAFAKGFDAYSEYHAQVGAPGGMEGAAGSSYLDVPVQLYGRRSTGEAFRTRSTVTMRRVNDVPGATPEQLRWHIERIEP